MKIGIDIFGGDFAPKANIEGAILAQKEFPQDTTLVLIGDQDIILSCLSDHGANPDDFEIVHAPDVITMHDHPTRAIPQKPNSSISQSGSIFSRSLIALDTFILNFSVCSICASSSKIIVVFVTFLIARR